MSFRCMSANGIKMSYRLRFANGIEMYRYSLLPRIYYFAHQHKTDHGFAACQPLKRDPDFAMQFWWITIIVTIKSILMSRSFLIMT